MQGFIHGSLLLLLPWLQFHEFVDVQYALPLVHFWRFTAANCAGELVHSILVDPSTADYAGLKAEDANGGWSSELNLVAVAQLQK
jgi:hypothetical protein